MNKKSKSTVMWNYNTQRDGSVSSLLLNACKNFIAIILMIISALVMAKDVYPAIIVDTKGLKYIMASVVILVFVFDIIIQSIEQHIKNNLRVFYQILIVLVGLVLVFFFTKRFYADHTDEIMNGFYAVKSVYLELYNWYYSENINMPNVGNADYISFFVVFLLIVCMGVCFCFSYITKSKRLFSVIPVTVLVSQMLVGKTPGWRGVALLCIGAYLTFEIYGVEKLAGRFSVKNKKKKTWIIDVYQTIAVLTVLFVVAYLIQFVDESSFDALMENKESVKTVQRNLENEAYESFLDLSYDAQRVSNKTPSYDDEVLFKITCDDKPQSNVYLKDYIGTNFTNGRWVTDHYSFETGCSSVGIELADMQKLLVESNFYYSKKASFHMDFFTRNHNSLTPYYFETDNEEIKELTKDTLISKQLSKKTFNYSGCITSDLNMDEISYYTMFINDDGTNLRYNWYKNYAQNNYVNISRKVPTAKKLARSIKVTKAGNSDLDVNMYIYQACAAVKDILSEYEYETNLDALDKDTNAVEYFLANSKKGYCIHFATAGTLILRELGIPARYASGYSIKQEEFVANGDGTYTGIGLDSCAHAWVEVFYPNIGWVPFEVTPGYYDIDYLSDTSIEQTIQHETEQLEQTTDIENEASFVIESQTQEEIMTQGVNDYKNPSPEDEKESAEPSSTNEVTGENEEEKEVTSQSEEQSVTESTEPDKINKLNIGKYILTVFCIFIGLIVIAYICLYIQKRKAQEKDIFSGYLRNHQYKKAVRKINRKLYKKMKRRGRFILQNPSDEEYRAALESCFDNISKEEWQQYMDIVKEAAYSGGNVEEKSAAFVINLYHKIT